MPLSLTHSKFRKVHAEFQQRSSVLSWSPLAPALNPFNQDSYNNLWSRQLATWLSTWGCIYRQSEVGNGVIYIKISISTLSEITRALYPEFKLRLWWVCFVIHLLIHLLCLWLSADIYSIFSWCVQTKISKKWVDFFLSVFETEV